MKKASILNHPRLSHSSDNHQHGNEFLVSRGENVIRFEYRQNGPPNNRRFCGIAFLTMDGREIRTFLSAWRSDKQSLRHLLADMIIVQLRLYWVVSSGTNLEFDWPLNIAIPELPSGLALCIDPPLPPDPRNDAGSFPPDGFGVFGSEMTPTYFAFSTRFYYPK